MAAWLADALLDAALQKLADDAENLYICSAQPSTYAEAQSTYALGVKASPSFTGPAAGDASGRKLTVDAISDGTVSATDTATHWAITDNSATALLAWGTLDAGEAVTDGNTFTLDAFDIEITDPA